MEIHPIRTLPVLTDSIHKAGKRRCLDGETGKTLLQLLLVGGREYIRPDQIRSNHGIFLAAFWAAPRLHGKSWS